MNFQERIHFAIPTLNRIRVFSAKWGSRVTHSLTCVIKACCRPLLKYFFAISTLMVCFLLTWLICARGLTKSLDFGQVFASTGKVSSDDFVFALNGTNGDKIIFVTPMPRPITNENGELSYPDISSEHLAMTSRTQAEIQSSLKDIDPKQWQVLTKLPSPIFRFNLELLSNITSPNNGKQGSYFVITYGTGQVSKLMPGQTVTIGKGLLVEDLSGVLASTRIDFYCALKRIELMFMDKSGNVISQATGTIFIKPTFWTKLFVFIGVWVFLIGLLALLKQTLLLPKDAKQVQDWYKHGN